MKLWTLLLPLGLSACMASSGPTNTNTCATPSSTYWAIFTELSGNCGPHPSQLVNVNDKGTIEEPIQFSCASEVVQGRCVVVDTDCTWIDAYSQAGYVYSANIGYTSDGVIAVGTMTYQKCPGRACTCESTYNVTMMRQSSP